MRLLIISAIAVCAFAAPAHATQGIMCETLEGPSRVISLGAGTHAAATWWAREEGEDGWIERSVGQHWIDSERLFVDLVNPDELTRIARIEARSEDGFEWLGVLRTEARTQAIRCFQS